MYITQPTNVNYLIASSGERLKIKLIDIGPWNLTVTTAVSAAHGLTLSKIKLLGAMIVNDAGTMTHFESGRITTAASEKQVFIYATATLVVARMNPILVFTDPDYNSTAMSRGTFFVLYED